MGGILFFHEMRFSLYGRAVQAAGGRPERGQMKGNGVATLAQNKIFPAKQELLLSEIT
jgi:hypothetical protein